MLQFARTVVGRPFSTIGMARSIFLPRQTNGTSYFCAELVADVLRVGSLLDKSSNPGAATPEGLHQLYRGRAAVTANPYLLRQANCQRALTVASVVRERLYSPPQLGGADAQHQTPVHHATTTAHAMKMAFPEQRLFQVPVGAGNRCNPAAARHATFPIAGTLRDAPLCGTIGSKSALQILNAGDGSTSSNKFPVGMTLNSLDFRKL